MIVCNITHFFILVWIVPEKYIAKDKQPLSLTFKHVSHCCFDLQTIKYSICKPDSTAIEKKTLLNFCFFVYNNPIS